MKSGHRRGSVLRLPHVDVDLYVEADLAAMARVWLGDLPFQNALRSGEVRLAGRSELAKTFPSWLMLSHFAGVPRPAAHASVAASHREARP